MNTPAAHVGFARPSAPSLRETATAAKADLRQLAGEVRALAEAEFLPRAQQMFDSVADTARREGRRFLWRATAHPLGLLAGAALGGLLLGLLIRRTHHH